MPGLFCIIGVGRLCSQCNACGDARCPATSAIFLGIMPQVVSARALTDDGQIATLAVDSENTEYSLIVLEVSESGAGDRGYSVSRSLHFWQVDNPGTAQERRRHPRATTMASSGASIRTGASLGCTEDCRSVRRYRSRATSRRGSGWLVTPVIADLPRES